MQRKFFSRAAEALEEKLVDRCDKGLDSAPNVQRARTRFSELVDNLWQLLEQYNAPQEAFQLLREIDDQSVNVECADITACVQVLLGLILKTPGQNHRNEQER